MHITVVHGGASTKRDDALSKACKAAVTSTEDVVEAVKILETDEKFNCGVGSSLTIEGTAELEACYMSSDGPKFGAVGCVKSILHVSEVARRLAIDKFWEKRGLLHPMFLVAEGAEKFASESGFPIAEPTSLVSNRAVENWKRAKRCVENSTFDTVGAISINLETLMAEACSSSGGVVFKNPGRLGHSCSYGSATWAEHRSGVASDDGNIDFTVAIATTGHGEALIRENFSRRLADTLFSNPDVLHVDTTSKLLQQSFPTTRKDIFGGVALIATRLHPTEDPVVELLTFHNCPFLPVAYRCDERVKSVSSVLPTDAPFHVVCQRIV